MRNNSEDKMLEDKVNYQILKEIKKLCNVEIDREKIVESQINLDLFDEEKQNENSNEIQKEKEAVNSTSRGINKEKRHIKNIIQKLSEEKFSNRKYKEIKRIIDELNEDENYRYDYFDIYVHVSEIADKEPLRLNYLTVNTEELNKRLFKAARYKRIDNKYSKLIQYIKLEAMRSYNDLEKRKKFDEENEKLKKDLEDTKKQLESSKRELEKQKFDMLAVLGVFSAIILAFTGGLNFSSSVLENMNSASIYRVLIISILLGFTLINGIAILLKFIKNISKDENEEMDRIEKVGFLRAVRDRYMISYIAKFNTIAVVLLVVVIFAYINDWFEFENSLNEKLRAIESANSKVLHTVISEEKNTDEKVKNQQSSKDVNTEKIIESTEEKSNDKEN